MAVTPGRFIVLEGVEGAGKSTQVALLSAWLDEAGVEHVVAREPGGTAVGEAIRAVLLDREDVEVPPITELLLLLAARAALVRDVVRPALAEGALVVADRYDLSTIAYQGYGRGIALDDVRRANAVATGGLRPDLYVVLDVSVREGRARQKAQGKKADRMEREGVAFLERVRGGYLAASEADPAVRVLPGRGRPEEVAARIREVLAVELPETFGDR